jgi:hypothetical protein
MSIPKKTVNLANRSPDGYGTSAPVKTTKVEKAKKANIPLPFPWGVAGFCCVALALVTASLIGSRWLTAACAVIGALVASRAVWPPREDRTRQDKIWFSASAILASLTLLLTAFDPGVLNSQWAIDRAVTPPDPNLLTAVPRDQAMQKGRVIANNEAIDAETEAFRQADVMIRIETAKIGQLAGKGDATFLVIRVRVANAGQGQSISLEGFNNHQPVLSDDDGLTYGFLEQRLKQIKNRTEVFEAWTSNQAVEVAPRGYQDVLLIFDPPPAGKPIQLELDSAAWGRTGKCRFRIAGRNPSK